MKTLLSVLVALAGALAIAAPSHAQRLITCVGGTLYENGVSKGTDVGGCRRDSDSDFVMLNLSAQPIAKENTIKTPEPPCVGTIQQNSYRTGGMPDSLIPNMGDEVSKHLVKASTSSDGVGDDGGWRSDQTNGRANCRVFAVVVPVPPNAIRSVRTTVHRHDRPNGDDSACAVLTVKTISESGWALEGPNATTRVGCSGVDYMAIDSLQVRAFPGGKAGVGAVFKNWRQDTAATLQFLVTYGRQASQPK